MGGLGSREQFERWLRPGRATRGLRPVHDIVRLPLLAPHLAESAVVGVARAALDEHVRIAQMHPRVLAASGRERATPRSPTGPVAAIARGPRGRWAVGGGRRR